MYGDYWNLKQPPFDAGCQPEFFFAGPSHEAALLKLQYVVEQAKGPALLVGEHGLGKTFVTRVLESQLSSLQDEEIPLEVAPFVRLMFPRLSADQTLSFLLSGLTEQPDVESLPVNERITQVEAALRRHSRENRSPVFLIDDAHLIDDPSVLQLLAQIAGLCETHGLALTILLIGQPNLLAQVQRVPALNDRITVRTALHPFSADETAAYIRHRLTVSGLEGSVFSDDALAAFHELSLGFPRKINQLCDLALLVGFADELPSLGRSEVEAAARELVSVSVD